MATFFTDIIKTASMFIKSYSKIQKRLQQLEIMYQSTIYISTSVLLMSAESQECVT